MHTLAKHKARVFFKSISTIISLLMYPKDPTPDAHKSYIIYDWKCPSHNCIAEYIGETNRSLKERVSGHRNQTISVIRNHHSSTKHPKAALKSFTIIERANPYTIEQKKHFTFISKIHHSTETLAKSESLQYSTNFSNFPHN